MRDPIHTHLSSFRFPLSNFAFCSGQITVRQYAELTRLAEGKMLIIRTVGISTLNFLSRFKHGGCGKNLVNKSSMLGKDTIDFRLPAAHFAGKNHAMGPGSQAQVAGQFASERFDVTLFPLEISEGNPKFFPRLGSKTA